MSNTKQITLKKEIINVDAPIYYVGVNEGAFLIYAKVKKII